MSQVKAFASASLDRVQWHERDTFHLGGEENGTDRMC